MSTLRAAYLVLAGAGTLYEFDSGATDQGVPIRVAVQFDPLIPAGAGGEAIFTTLYLTVTSSMAVTLTVTPLLDGVPRSAERQTVAVPGGEQRQTHHFEVPLYMQESFGRFALRGTRLSVRVEAEGLAEGALALESVEVEHETVRESKQPPKTP